VTLRAQLAGLLRVRSSQRQPEVERHATWLELFFDLVVVLTLSSVIQRLGERAGASGREIAITFGLFALVQWAWVGHSFYDTRFDPDDLVHRLLVFVAAGGAGALALGVRHVPGGLLLPVGYLLVRGALIAMYLRVCTTNQASREICAIYLTGFGAGWLLWLASLAFDPSTRPIIWGIAFTIELLTPWVGYSRLSRYPVDTSHLPERLGQFTVILLGASLTDLLTAIPAPNPPGAVLAAAVAAFVVPVCVWWTYTTFVTTRAALPRLRGGQVYTYLHVPYGAALFFLGWALGAVVHQIAEDSSRLPGGLRLVLGGSVTLWMLGGLALHWHSRGELPWRRVLITVLGVAPIIGITVGITAPMVMLLLVVAVVVGYTAVVVRRVTAEVEEYAAGEAGR
jgi:low temperature requirement protein LtrA